MLSHNLGTELGRFRAPVELTKLIERLECQIERRACGRIRDLHVQCMDDLIVLKGRSRTYHAKQIAQEAVLDSIDAHYMLANQIVVF